MENPTHVKDCAKVCEFLTSMKFKAELNDGNWQNSMSFPILMITRMKREFEQNLKADLEVPDSIRQESNRRSMGNIRLIGKLYILRMLTDRAMHEIIQKLLDASGKEALECLYWLLTTCGKNLEKSTNMKFASRSNIDPIFRQNIQGLKPFDEYFAKIDEIVKTKEYPSHVKCLLQNVIDLRENDWKPLAQSEEIQDCETSMVKMLEKQTI